MKKDKAEMKRKFFDETFPVLYILMRSDLASLNAGKAMAQASHAANAMVYRIKHGKTVTNKHMKNMLNKWETDTKQGFGTCLVLDCHNESDMLEVLSYFTDEKNAIADIINDPTYPVRDGEITHYISLNTCGYVFLDKNDDALCEPLKLFGLYK